MLGEGGIGLQLWPSEEGRMAASILLPGCFVLLNEPSKFKHFQNKSSAWCMHVYMHLCVLVFFFLEEIPFFLLHNILEKVTTAV